MADLAVVRRVLAIPAATTSVPVQRHQEVWSTARPTASSGRLRASGSAVEGGIEEVADGRQLRTDGRRRATRLPWSLIYLIRATSVGLLTGSAPPRRPVPVVGFHAREPDASLLLSDSRAVSVELFGHNVGDRDELAALVSELREAAGETLLVAVDEKGGEVTRLDHASGSAYPTAWALGAADDPHRAGAEAVAADLAAAGVNLDLAPVADVNSDPDGHRAPLQGTCAVASTVMVFVTGLQSAGIAACAKHFPARCHASTPTSTCRSSNRPDPGGRPRTVPSAPA